MDAFETRMQFLQLLRRLTSAAQSINKVVSFLLKHSSAGASARSSRRQQQTTLPSVPSQGANQVDAPSTHEEADLWECILEELGEKSTINSKINIFYMLDSLLDQSLTIGIQSYKNLIQRDLEKVVDLTVPRHLSEGVLNRMSAIQVLNSWRHRRMLPVSQLEALIDSLETATFPPPSTSLRHHTFSRNDILRRVEDDRERHKRLRERIWVLPIPSLLDMSSSAGSSSKLATILSTVTVNTPEQAEPQRKLISLAGYTKALPDGDNTVSQGQTQPTSSESENERETALDVEFETAWEKLPEAYKAGKLDKADLQAIEQENLRCFM